MGGVQRKKGNTAKNKTAHRLNKARAYRRDHDLIHEDLAQPQLVLQKVKDVELPGAGEFYCISCARHFMDKQALSTHCATKGHKRRLKLMKQQPYKGPV